MQDAEGFLFVDLDAALRCGSSEKGIVILRQITDPLLSRAKRLNEEQIGVFETAKAPMDHTLHLAHRSTLRFSEDGFAALQDVAR